MTDERKRHSRIAVLAAIAVLSVACGPAVPTVPSPSATALATPGTTPESTSGSSPTTLGGYRWIPVEPRQFGGVGLTAVAERPDGGLFAIGDDLTGEADGTLLQPSTWTSPDGSVWTRLPDSPAFVSRRSSWEELVSDVVPYGSGFIAVGVEEQSDGSSADAAAWHSPDGKTWTRSSVADGTGRTMDQVVATDHGFVAIGEAEYSFHAGFGGGTAIWTSHDGRAWTRLADKAAPPRGTALRAIVASSDAFLSTAWFEHSEGETTSRQPVTAGIWQSADAIHWQPIPGTPLGVAQIVHTQRGLVAIGSDGSDESVRPASWRSDDGRSWTPVELPEPDGLPAGTAVYPQRLAAGTDGYLALGEREDDFSAVGWTSVDGTAWSLVDLTGTVADARIDHVWAVGGSILVVGDRIASDSRDPVVWLLSH